MKFIRLTSVFLCCSLLSSFLILPASAVDDDNYYSFSPVGASEPSPAIDWPVNPAEFSNDDSRTLTRIYEIIQYLYLSPSSWQRSSVIGFLERILDAIPSNLSDNFGFQGLNRGTNTMLDEISEWTMHSYNYLSSDNIAGNLGNIQRNTLNTNDAVLKGNSFLSTISDKVATEATLDSFFGAFNHIGSLNSEFTSDSGPLTDLSLASYIRSAFGFTTNPSQKSFDTKPGKGFYYNAYAYAFDDYSKGGSGWFSWSGLMSSMLSSLVFDGKMSSLVGGNPTLYHYIRRLGDVLASDDDKALSESQKPNREQIEQDFLSGSSGKTSLGRDDFGSLSSVGGTFKDTISLNGQSSLSDLSSGLSDADTAGQGWFSQATKDSLDAVSGSGSSESTVSTFSDDGLSSVDVDPDPYHMQGFEDNYAWLWGDD